MPINVRNLSGINGPRQKKTRGRLRNALTNVASKRAFPVQVARRPISKDLPSPNNPRPPRTIGGATTSPQTVEVPTFGDTDLDIQEQVEAIGAGTAAVTTAQLQMLQQQQTQFLQQQEQSTAMMTAMQAALIKRLQELQQRPGPTGRGGKVGRLPRGAEFVGKAHIGNRPLVRWNNITLAKGAMRSLIKASRTLGRPIVGGGYRSHAQQVALQYKAAQGIPVAPPGKSLHEQGLAIDVNMNFLRANPRLVGILERLGWHRFSPSREPWHFSYRRVG